MPDYPKSASGPGKFSKRTDKQPTAVPNVGDSPDLEHGDRQMLEASQKIAPARGSAGASLGRQLTGAPQRQDKLPPWFLQGDDPNPSEPTTAGLDIGPGPGRDALMAPQPADDVRELVLEYLYTNFANEDAREMLHGLRQERAAKMAMPPVAAPTIDAPSFSSLEPQPAPPGGEPAAPTTPA